MLYYNNIAKSADAMTDHIHHTHSHRHTHHHHRHPGHGHPPAPATLSLLRMSVARRLAIAAGLIAALWLGVIWAVMS